eukprot:TRINITY_DN17182_c0_g1_i1.p2 TRINITY_DN17182_c0_g1~~TRINITY_DN17182_c0_g1_i1.p2  ORF type:complete len:104 (+),score=27.38 TRINITY_DN17182_c0_g1_i1:145-456(+)
MAFPADRRAESRLSALASLGRSLGAAEGLPGFGLAEELGWGLGFAPAAGVTNPGGTTIFADGCPDSPGAEMRSVSYTHLRAHETVLDLVCRLLLEKKKYNRKK